VAERRSAPALVGAPATRYQAGANGFVRMEWSEIGIAVGTRRHGEADIILEVVTEARGRHLGLVRGGRSRRLRPVLQPGNTLSLTWRARLDEHLGNFRVEPVTERSSGLTASRLGAYGLALAAAHLRLLPERDPHPRLYAALVALLDRLEEPPLAAELMARFELLLLDEIGFGLDLERCAATGSVDDLAFVSPRSGRAVGRQAGAAYAGRLLPLPAFLAAAPGRGAEPDEAAEALRLTGYFLDRHVYAPRGEKLPDCRARFVATLGASAPPKLQDHMG
jgi:DNA repair protein RecO (recombination protein O)